jgi:hypothetical protein
MMGAIEEGGKVAVSLTDALKQRPDFLGLIVVVIVFMIFVGFIAFYIHQRNEGERTFFIKQIELMHEECFKKSSLATMPKPLAFK